MTSRPKSGAGVEDKYAHIKPLPSPPKRTDAMRQFLPNSRTCLTLRHFFKDRVDVLINGQGYLCYDIRDRSNWTVLTASSLSVWIHWLSNYATAT